MAVIEVKFNPSIWTYTSGGTGGYSVFMDKDNATCWVFEAYGGGWAHVRLSDGTVLRQDTLFGQADRGNAGGPFWFNNWYPHDFQSWFAQDGSGNYYYTAQSLAGSSTYLYQFNLTAGSSGNLLNGYCTVTGTLDLAVALTGSPWTVGSDPVDSCLWTHPNGHTYFGLMLYGSSSYPGFIVVDVATMAVVTTQQVSNSVSPQPTGYSIFADNTGRVWGTSSDSNGNVSLISWDPVHGTSTGSIPQSVHGLPTNTETSMAVIGYLPASNYLFLSDVDYLNGTPARAGTGNVAIINLSTLALVTFLTDNNTFYHNALGIPGSHTFLFPSGPCAVQCFDALAGGATPITPTHASAFIIEGALDFNVDDSQVGGVLNFVDQTSLSVLHSLNVTTTINTGGVADPLVAEAVPAASGGENGSPNNQIEPFTSVAWNPNINKGAATYDLAGNLGSALYIFDTPSVGPTAPGASLGAAPTSIPLGNSSTLTWSITGTYISASIDNGVGSLGSSSGTVSVSPSTTTTYTLSVVWSGGTVTAPATVTVIQPPGLSLSASPNPIPVTTSSTLSWNITGTYASASIDHGIGSLGSPSGTASVSPSVTTTYTLSVVWAGGTLTHPTTLVVDSPPTATFSASPSTVNYNGSSVLSWNISGASTSASINNGVGSVGASGTHTVSSLTTSTTYTLSIVWIGGTVTYQTLVQVIPVPSLTALPTAINSGATSTLTWGVQGGYVSAAINQGVGPVTGSGGTAPVTPTTTTTYTLEVVWSGGTVTASADVWVTTDTNWLYACKEITGEMFVCRVPHAYNTTTPGVPSLWYDIGPGGEPKIGIYDAANAILSFNYNSQLSTYLLNTVGWPPTTVTPSSYTVVESLVAISQAYAEISGYDLLFYVTSANNLCVQQLNHAVAPQTLVSGVTWVTAAVVGTTVNVYYTNLIGQIYHFQFTTANFSNPVSTAQLSTLGTAVSMSALYTTSSTPNVYALMVDNGTTHVLYCSEVHDFSSIVGQVQTYDNSNPAIYVGFPTMAIHPEDTILATVIVQITTLSDSDTQVGFYVVALPGVV